MSDEACADLSRSSIQSLPLWNDEIGLIALARTDLDTMATDIQEIIKIDAACLRMLLQLSVDVNQATIVEKNILAVRGVEALVPSARTPEIRATYGSLKSLIMSDVTRPDQNIDQSPMNAAIKISDSEGHILRLKVMEVLNEPVSISTGALEKSTEARALALQTLWALVTSATPPSLSC